MSKTDKAKQLKAQIISFVEQTQVGGPNPVSFNEFSRQNPDRKLMEKQIALKIAVTLVKSGNARLVVDNDTLEIFNPLKFLEFVEKDDKKQIIEEYSRFLSRPDIMGAAYSAENQTYLGAINFEAIQKVNAYIKGMDLKDKQEFVKVFNTYMRFEILRVKDLIKYSKKVTEYKPEDGEEDTILPKTWKERGKYIGRYLAILFSHDFIFEGDALYGLECLPEFLAYFFQLLKNSIDTFLSHLDTFPKKMLDGIVEQLQNMLAIYVVSLVNEENTKEQIKFTIKCLSYLQKSNTRNPRLDRAEFVNETVSDNLNMKYIAKQYYQRAKNQTNPMNGIDTDFVYLDYPWMFSTAAKVDVLQSESKLIQNDEIIGQLINGLGNNLGGLMALAGGINLKLNIRRNNILEDALSQLSSKSSELKMPLKVKFVGEQGVDEGGVRKEFFHLLIEELFNPNYAMFVQKNNRFMWLNKSSFECGVNFELIGTLLGLAIYNSVLLDLKFPRVVYKKLLDEKPTLQDLQEIEPDLFNTLRNISIMEENFDTLCMTMSISYDNFGAEEIFELVPGGKDIPLTRERRDEFIQLYVDWYFNKSISKQFKPFFKGFYKVISKESIRLFDVGELIDLVCGKEELDFKELEKSTRYEGYDKDSQAVKWFWEILHSFDNDNKKKFLLFSTGSDRSPLRGLSDLRFIVGRQAADDTRLPSTHTCFNHFLLPEYSSKEILESKLKQAMENCEGFGLV